MTKHTGLYDVGPMSGKTKNTKHLNWERGNLGHGVGTHSSPERTVM